MRFGAGGIIFDLDGVLVDSESLSISTLVEVLQGMGVKNANFDDIRSQFLGVSIQKIHDYAVSQIGEASFVRFITDFETQLFEKYKTQLTKFDGVDELLDQLDERNIPFAIASGGSVLRVAKTLEFSGLANRFEQRAFSADLVKRGKPSPDIYLYAAERIGVEPQKCIVIEDSPHGIQGARAADMHAIGFLGGTHLEGIRHKHGELLREMGASAIASDVPELIELLELNED